MSHPMLDTGRATVFYAVVLIFFVLSVFSNILLPAVLREFLQDRRYCRHQFAGATDLNRQFPLSFCLVPFPSFAATFAVFGSVCNNVGHFHSAFLMDRVQSATFSVVDRNNQ